MSRRMALHGALRKKGLKRVTMPNLGQGMQENAAASNGVYA